MKPPPSPRWPDGRTRKAMKARFAGHESVEGFVQATKGAVYFRVRRRRLLCLFVLAPQGEPNPKLLCSSVSRRRRVSACSVVKSLFTAVEVFYHRTHRSGLRPTQKEEGWPDGRTRKDTKTRFAGHERRGAFSCPPKAAFVSFRVSPAGAVNRGRKNCAIIPPVCDKESWT